jgi:mannose/fructose/N-acetylgalactosamine-specific phosphotransferase system component IIC
MTLPDPGQWIAFALLAALVALDAGPWLLSMVSRPLPAAALLGLLWGEPGGGAIVGAMLELVYAGILPVGAARYPDAGLAGVVGAGVALWSAPALGAPSLLLGLVWGLVAGQVGKAIETWRRSRNAPRVARARARALAGDAGALPRVVAGSLAFAGALGACSALGLFALGIVLATPLVDIAPALFAVRPPLFLFAALGCGAALRLWGGVGVRMALGAGVVAGFLVGLLAAGAERV